VSVYPVSTAKEKLLKDRMAALGISEEDIQESFIRAGGKGGQHLNKTSTCVHLKHMPTGIEVKCQQERSQAFNRYRAREILVDKIEDLIRGRESAAQQRIEKIRRQKRRRSKRAKEKMLEKKRMVAEKKKSRARISSDNE